MDGRRLGRIALVGDACYCAVAALCVLIFAGPLAAALGVSRVVMVLAAFVTAAWSVALHLVSRQGGLRPWLARVLVANVLAAGLIAVLAVNRSPNAFSLLLLAVAAEVGAFAVVQAVALRRAL